MKKTMIVLCICMLLVSCNNDKSNDIISIEPIELELTTEENSYFDNLFKYIFEANNLTIVEKKLKDLYLGDKLGRKKYYYFIFLDDYETDIRIAFDEDKKGCSLRIDIPYNQENFYNKDQFDLFIELYRTVLNPNKEEESEVYQYINTFFEKNNLVDMNSQTFKSFILSKIIMSFDKGSYILLTIKLKDSFCI